MIQLGRFETKLTVIALVLLTTPLVLTASKVVNYGPKLQELIDLNSHKSWLVKFYAPWCHHCQQLEPTWINVAEKVYSSNDDLIVGRVDCQQYPLVCESFKITSYPTILYLNKDHRVEYKGDRSLESILDFGERLTSPLVGQVDTCNQARQLKERHQLVILSTLSDQTTSNNDANNSRQRIFEQVANKSRPWFWFYRLRQPCADDYLEPNQIYILKRRRAKPIQFKGSLQSDDLANQLMEWIFDESLPVFARMGSDNYRHYMRSIKDRTLAIAIVDEYRPARRLSKDSRKFYNRFEKVVRRITEAKAEQDSVVFAWTSDILLVEYFAIGELAVPNIMLLRQDYSYITAIDDPRQDSAGIAEKLSEQTISDLINGAINGSITRTVNFQGGSSYLQQVKRAAFGAWNRTKELYHANGLLFGVVFGLPAVIILIVIYTTCREGVAGAVATDDGAELNRHQDGHFSDDDDDIDDDGANDNDDDEEQVIGRYGSGGGGGRYTDDVQEGNTNTGNTGSNTSNNNNNASSSNNNNNNKDAGWQPQPVRASASTPTSNLASVFSLVGHPKQD